MARIFTTLFTYNGKEHTAIVSQVDGVVTLHVPDEELHGILPQGKYSFHSQKGIKINGNKLTPTQHLVLIIFAAIEAQHSQVPVQ